MFFRVFHYQRYQLAKNVPEALVMQNRGSEIEFRDYLRRWLSSCWTDA